MKPTWLMLLLRYPTGGPISLHPDRSHNVPLKHEVLLKSNAAAAAAAALRESKVSGLGLMKGERRSAVTGEAVAEVH